MTNLVKIVVVILALALTFILSLPNTVKAQQTLRVVETRKIYDNNAYCAFTGLTTFRGKYYCTFREASSHWINYDDSATWGKIVLLESNDAKDWVKVAVFQQDSTDMRDPKIKITPDGRQLFILYHKHRIYKEKQGGTVTDVIFLRDSAINQSEVQRIKIKGFPDEANIGIWNLSQYKNKLYGFFSSPKFVLVSTTDGLNYEIVADLTDFEKREQRISESNIVFVGKNAYAVIRGHDDQGYFGESQYPFKKWIWRTLNILVGGPNLYVVNRNKILLGSRDYGRDKDRGKTVIYELNKFNWAEAKKIAVLESTNDSSYPCFIALDKNHLMVSYYSGNSSHSNIYVAVLEIE